MSYQIILAQMTYSQLTSAIQDWKNILQPQDYLILFDEAVFALQYTEIEQIAQRCGWQNICVFQHDAHLVPAHLQQQITLIDYSHLADMVVLAKRVIPLK